MSLSVTDKNFKAPDKERAIATRNSAAPSKPCGPSVKVRIMPAILRRLQKAGLLLEPFFSVLEGDNAPVKHPAKPQAQGQDFRFGFIEHNEFDTLAEFEQTEDRQTLRAWLDEGKRCFAVWNGSRLAATMWCDFQEFSFTPNYRQLDEGEVYLFAAYSHPDYRGHGIAPLMRIRCYKALRETGITRFYSYTEYFNAAARRFKEKLGARNESLRLHIRLLNRWSTTLTLRNYR